MRCSTSRLSILNALLYFQIVDPFKATYEINNLPNAIEKLTQTTLRNIIGELELDETLTSRDTINKKLSAVLDDATDKWGVKVNRVELQDITPPDSVLTAMEKQMQAERNKRAQILTSEGQKAAEILASEGEKTAVINKAQAAKEQAILEAEGQAQARIRVAEAEAKAIELITEAVGKSTNPANYLLAQKYIQMMQELAEGDKTKTVYLPYESICLTRPPTSSVLSVVSRNSSRLNRNCIKPQVSRALQKKLKKICCITCEICGYFCIFAPD